MHIETVCSQRYPSPNFPPLFGPPALGFCDRSSGSISFSPNRFWVRFQKEPPAKHDLFWKCVGSKAKQGGGGDSRTRRRREEVAQVAPHPRCASTADAPSKSIMCVLYSVSLASPLLRIAEGRLRQVNKGQFKCLLVWSAGVVAISGGYACSVGLGANGLNARQRLRSI